MNQEKIRIRLKIRLKNSRNVLGQQHKLNFDQLLDIHHTRN